MRFPTKFVISPYGGENFKTTKEVNGKDLVINTSIEYAENVNRVGVVEEIPLDYEGIIQKGDKVVVQHNVFRDYFDGKGLTRKSDFHIKDNLYQCAVELVFLIIKDNEFLGVDDFCFVEPIFEEKKWIGKTEVQHVGIVKYDNKTLNRNNVFKGDKIAFKKDSEYPFDINGEVSYRMRNRNILCKLE
jgi:co-chaperonin GroES (HSP10)